LGQATGFEIDEVTDAVLVYNTASRTNVGFDFKTIESLDVYNMTAHLCDRCVKVEGTGTFRNLALSAYPGNTIYKEASGFYAPTGSIDVDDTLYYGLGRLVESAASQTIGAGVLEKQLLYMDEPNDDLTPDYISEAVGAGVENPLSSDSIDIGGTESAVTTETTAKRDYWYNLLDNSFWNIEDPQAAEVTFIKALQSRVLASAEVETTEAKNDAYLKLGDSTEKFSEIYPMYARYATASQFKKRVMDMWYSGQNGATIQAYQNSIGGYSLIPSFFKRMEDYADGWIIDQSYVNHDNWLNGSEDLKYGIAIDVLGTSTMNQATSGECYTNVQNTVSDVAPIHWFLYDEVEPPGYLVFKDLYNDFEQCTLENMHYNDDFNISITTTAASGSITTPLIPTASVGVSGISNYVELSLLDRTYSESVDRHVYYRQGADVGSMSSWEELTAVIGAVLPISSLYVQLKITVANVIRELDYEFIGLAFRDYTSERDWVKPQDSIAMYSAGYNEDGDIGLTMFYNGSTWSAVSNPTATSDQFLKVWGMSENDVWAVGYNDAGEYGIVYHWNGSNWTHAFTGPSKTKFKDVHGTSFNNVWVAVDATDSSRPSIPDLYHWDGETWEAFSILDDDDYDMSLESVYSVTSTDVWVSGAYYEISSGHTHGALFHYNGTSWTEMVTGAATSIYRPVYAVSANDVWTCGMIRYAYHWNGATWTSKEIRVSFIPRCMASLSSNAVWCGGSIGVSGGALYKWDGTSWSTVSVAGLGIIDPIVRIQVFSEDDIWISTLAPFSEEVGNYHWDGNTWADLSPSPKKNSYYSWVVSSY
jgi:hypothetical protein